MKSNPSEFIDFETLLSGIGDTVATVLFFPGDTIILTLLQVTPGLAGLLGISDFDVGDTLSAILSLVSWVAMFLCAKRILD
jgi:hypothetical protein